MPLMPERVKYRKMHRGNRAGLASRGQLVSFGEYGLMAMERCWLDTKQLEAARVAVARNMKRHGKMWIRVFPQKSFTKKPLETRMGTNVLCAYSGEVKLTDFGLASSTLKLEKTAPGVIYGKVSYMSPEQARGEALDGRTDLYAAGL